MLPNKNTYDKIFNVVYIVMNVSHVSSIIWIEVGVPFLWMVCWFKSIITHYKVQVHVYIAWMLYITNTYNTLFLPLLKRAIWFCDVLNRWKMFVNCTRILSTFVFSKDGFEKNLICFWSQVGTYTIYCHKSIQTKMMSFASPSSPPKKLKIKK